jgi:DNA repair exonuclease SbcCD ATPase subunit
MECQMRLNDVLSAERLRSRELERQRDEARLEVMRLQDNDSAYDAGYQRADAAAGAVIERLRRERAEARARAAHFESLAKDQQTLNAAMVASLKRGLAQLEASEAEVARLRALLERSVEYFDYMEDRGYSSVRALRSDVAAALAGRCPAPVRGCGGEARTGDV